jgi:hypothetical protein
MSICIKCPLRNMRPLLTVPTMPPKRPCVSCRLRSWDHHRQQQIHSIIQNSSNQTSSPSQHTFAKEPPPAKIKWFDFFKTTPSEDLTFEQFKATQVTPFAQYKKSSAFKNLYQNVPESEAFEAYTRARYDSYIDKS